jgi:MFS family permease
VGRSDALDASPPTTPVEPAVRPGRAALPVGGFGRARYLLLGQVLTSTGTGAMMAATAVFLVRSVRLPVGQVGAGLAIVGAVGLVSLPAVGALIDRCGGRAVAIVSTGLAAVATACFGWISSLATFVLIEGVANTALQAAAVAQRALVGQAMPGGERVRFQAANRSAANLGYALGAVCAIPAMAVDTRRSYLLMFFAAAVATGAALPCTWYGPRPAGTRERKPPWTALTDARYLVLTVLCGLLTVRHRILTLAIPAWIVVRTGAWSPRSSPSAARSSSRRRHGRRGAPGCSGRRGLVAGRAADPRPPCIPDRRPGLGGLPRPPGPARSGPG